MSIPLIFGLPNVFGDLKDMLFNGWKWLNHYGLEFLIAPVHSNNGSWVSDLLGSAWGWAKALSVLATLLLIFLAGTNTRKYLGSAVSAFLVVLAIAVVGGAWFALYEPMLGFGNFLTHSVMNHTMGQSAMPLNPVGSLIGAIVGYPMVGYPMGIMILISIMYMVAGIVFQALGIVGFALRFIGDKMAVFSDFLLACMLMTTFIGRPVAALCVGIGNQLSSSLSNSLPARISGETGSVIAFVCSAAGWWFAILWQIILLIFCFVGVAKVTGNIKTVGEWVNGKVETTPAANKVNEAAHAADYRQSMSHLPAATDSSPSSRSGKVVRYVKQEAGHQAIAAGARAIAATTSGGSSLAAKAVTTAAHRAIQRHTPKDPNDHH